MEITAPFEVPGYVVVAVREVVPVAQISELYDRVYPLLGEVLAKAGVAPVAARGYYLAPPTDVFDVAPAFVVDSDSTAKIEAVLPEYGERGVEIMHFEKTQAVKTTLLGSYDQLGKAWSDFGGAVVRAGHSMGAWTCEEYLNMPGEVSEEELRTDLYCAIR